MLIKPTSKLRSAALVACCISSVSFAASWSVATLTASGDGRTSADRVGLADFGTWPQGILDPTTSPVDLSFLNAPEEPAGRHGFLTVRAEKLMFEDGSVGGVWGANWTAYSLFGTSRDDVKREAHRLSQLGFNLVRMPHQDSKWVNPNIFGDAESPDTRTLSATMLDKLDWWIKCLKDEGIYIWLDLEVGRQIKPGDEIQDFDELRQGKPSADLKGYSYVNKSIQMAMQRFNVKYLNHRNRFTGLRFKDDPAIAAV